MQISSINHFHHKSGFLKKSFKANFSFQIFQLPEMVFIWTVLIVLLFIKKLGAQTKLK